MRSEYLPLPCTQPLKYRRSFPCTQLGISIHRSHQYRRILIVFLLFGSKAFDIDVDVAMTLGLISAKVPAGCV